jgi:hypothetical protein
LKWFRLKEKLAKKAKTKGNVQRKWEGWSAIETEGTVFSKTKSSASVLLRDQAERTSPYHKEGLWAPVRGSWSLWERVGRNCSYTVSDKVKDENLR